MFISRAALAALCVYFALCTPLFALPKDFTLANRTLIVDSSDPARASSVILGGGQASFQATLTDKQTAQSYALRVEGTPPAEGWQVSVNGAPLEIDPVAAPDGLWYTIPEWRLAEGDNKIQVEAPAGSPAVVAGLLGFSINFAEEEHFMALVAPQPAPPASDPNQYLYDVQHMDMAITIATGSNNISAAAVTVTARSLQDGLSQCVLDFYDNMTISSVDSGPSTPNLSFSEPGTNKVYITLASPVAAGNDFTVRVNYSGTPSNGYFRSTHGSSVPIVYTYNQPYYARRWFPCKDLPEDKFTIDIHATVPTVSYNGHPFSVVSNGTLVSTVPSGGNTIYNWQESYLIATQYVSLCCSNYQVSSGTYTALDNVTVMPVAHHVYPESYATEAGEVTRTIEVMERFAEQFGEYPFLNEKYVTATWTQGGGMEHQTCTSMPNGNLATPYHRRNIHELFHMWLGDCIGIRTFEHLWLSEGWATYAEVLWLDYKNGPVDADARMDYYRTNSSDAHPIISSQADGFNMGVEYYKAAWVVHMLRHVVGETAFFQGTRNYLADPDLRYKTVVTDDFRGHIEALHGSDLSWFFDQWLLRASRPAYEWMWGTHQDGGNWYLDIAIEQTQSDSVYTMPIDFGVTFSGGTTTTVQVSNNQRTQSFSINVGSLEPTAVTFDPDEWLLYSSATNVSGDTPSPPVLYSVVGNGATNSATITWTPPASLIVGYRLHESADGLSGWTLIQNESVLGVGATSTVVTGIPFRASRYYRMTAVGSVDESIVSDVYGTRLGLGAADILVVDGYDRWNSQHAGANHVLAASHGRGIAGHGNSFDTCANEAVTDGAILLSSYIDVSGSTKAVVWFCGDETTDDETFSSTEQALVSGFLEGGGKLFVTGNEIGWDLDYKGSTSDKSFFNNYLKADYVSDDSNDYTVDPASAGSCFAGHSFTYGNGGDAPYQPGWPDVVSAYGGSSASLIYNTGVVAGTQYTGVFGSSSTPGAVVFLGFAYETVFPEASRLQMMYDVLEYFGLGLPVGLSGFSVE